VVLVCKKHPFVLLHPLLISVLVLLIPVLVYVFSPTGLLLSLTLIMCGSYALVHIFLAYYGWKNTILLLTTERVVFLEQRGLMHREFVECALSSIQQVSHEVHGVRQTLFGYGTIAVYTGGSQQPVQLRDIPDPYEMQQEIQRAAAGEGFMELDEEDTKKEA